MCKSIIGGVASNDENKRKPFSGRYKLQHVFGNSGQLRCDVEKVERGCKKVYLSKQPKSFKLQIRLTKTLFLRNKRNYVTQK